MANTTILCGGDFGGRAVDAAGWALNSIREFQDADGNSHFYRNDDGIHAIYVGPVNPLAPPPPVEEVPLTLDTKVITLD